jgi:hypothetical protein
MSESPQEVATANYLKAMKDLGSPVLLVFGPPPGELLDSLLAGRTAYLQVHTNVDDTMPDGRRTLEILLKRLSATTLPNEGLQE